jgi:hypothetical protein
MPEDYVIKYAIDYAGEKGLIDDVVALERMVFNDSEPRKDSCGSGVF